MEDPARDIKPVIHILTTGQIEHQQKLISQIYTKDASFDHPFCRVESGSFPVASRDVIAAAYRFYKFLSPQIDIDIKSTAFDEENARLYVTADQTATFWFVPWHQIRVELVSALDLVAEHETVQYADALKKEGEKPVRWYINKQSDLYQSDQLIAFLPFLLPGAPTFFRLWRRMASLFIVFLVMIGHFINMLFSRSAATLKTQRSHVSERLGKSKNRMMKKAGRTKNTE